MNTTIFCTFEHQDIADLAMGHIRRVGGVKSIHYVHDRNSRSMDRLDAAGAFGAVTATSGSGFGWGFAPVVTGMGRTPAPRPVTVKIVCASSAKNTVVSRLVNQHAHRIITTPR